MALNTVFLEIMLVVLCINGMIFVFDELIDDATVSPLKTPLSLSTNITAVAQPAIFNNTDPTNTLIGNITGTSQTNSTGGGETIGFFDQINFFINGLFFFINLITGGFLWSVLGIFGFPDAFIFILQGILGFLLALSIFYYLSGR